MKRVLTTRFATGVSFSLQDVILPSVQDVLGAEEAVAIRVDGKKVREPSGPKGLPYFGNFFEIYPDHLGNHQRLFDLYGPMFKTTTMGRTVYHTNDPVLAGIIFAESEFFSKVINEDHPLYPIKNQEAGVFLGDTNTEEWRIVHKFLPPAFGPKAVRHYAPTMQKTIEDTFKVFDELDERGEAWNVYPYMLKLGSQAVGKLVLGYDFHHFDSVDALPHELVMLMAESLELNKKATSRGAWYASLPFGDPRRLRNMKERIFTLIEEPIQSAKRGGIEDLDLQGAALKAENMIGRYISCQSLHISLTKNTPDYVLRATDSKGNKLPKTSFIEPLVVATGAGFTTTSSLLSWLIYGLVTYPGMQDRLLQELVDNGFDETTQITAELTSKLTFLDKYIKETQRRHNPSFQPARTALRDVILPRGYRIPEGAVVIVALHHIHNNPAVWESPAKFDPDRWDTDAVKNRHKAAYIPFATGPRSCIGFNFALQEVKVFLPKLVYRYRFEREDETETVEYDPMFQLIRPNNLYVRAERRTEWPARSTE